VILVGLDDTDVVGSPGTNHLARALVGRLGAPAGGAMVLRHQLLFDRRVPYTSGNGSASITLPEADPACADAIAATAREALRGWFVEGSDPGLCVATVVPAEVVAFARRCQRQIVEQGEARTLATTAGIHLEGLGGTEGGVIGALAAVGLAHGRDDGRVVHRAGWPWPDDLTGAVSMAQIRARGVEAVVVLGSGREVTEGDVQVGRRLRPNVAGGRVVLFVEPAPPDGGAAWVARRT
jgi:hypothetical protein